MFNGCRVADIAAHYITHELDNDQIEAITPKSYTTIANYRRNLEKRIIPRWGRAVASEIQPPEIEEWLKSLRVDQKLANGTCDRHRRIMSLVYTSAQRYGLLPRGKEHHPFTDVRCRIISDYEAMIITPAQAFAIWSKLRAPENVLLLLAASTGLRISECLGLQWGDVSFAAQVIQVRRSWTGGKIGRTKTAGSRAAVPCGPILSNFLQSWRAESPYSRDEDWVFPSFRKKGRTPRVANMLCADHLRPAAIAAGVLKKERHVRFGFHSMRHSLASFLVSRGENPAVVQKLLRHSNVSTTLGIYSHAPNEARLNAQSDIIAAFFAPISLQKKEEGVGKGVQAICADLPTLPLSDSKHGGQGRD